MQEPTLFNNSHNLLLQTIKYVIERMTLDRTQWQERIHVTTLISLLTSMADTKVLGQSLGCSCKLQTQVLNTQPQP